ncbi:MAG TPA: hypothetical protein VM346_08550 [Sphingomicrobium sp.]|nr:hypothetical protein [Sphingomicrobium sp.]
MACRAVADPQERLACFDRESGTLDQAVASRDIVLIDREQATAARRSLFGFSIPSFGGLLGSGSAEDEIREIESTIASFSRNVEGGWTVRLADGSTWTQSDDSPVALAPRNGQKATVRRRALGSFMMSINGQPGVKVRRIA